MSNKICGGCRYFDEEVSHCERFEWATREHYTACNDFKPIEERGRKMSVDRLHIICGNCGHDATGGNFTWRYRPKEDYGNGEFNPTDVLISCKNCGTLHDLGKYMQEESEVKDE